jgi:hypothetical protein
MAERTQELDTTEETGFRELEEPITPRIVLSAMVGGIVGLAAMAPVIAGIPILLGVFEFEALAEFGNFVIAQSDATLGLAFFIGGGAIVLPLFFVVTASFLPPREPRYLRGATISSMFWVSFVFIFWPDAALFVNALFLVVTLVAHWIYGITLGLVMHRLTGIPEHEV